MRQKQIIIIVSTAVSVLISTAQTFTNLDFESAQIVSAGIQGHPELVQFSPAFPGWSGGYGGEALYDNYYLDTTAISIIDSGWPPPPVAPSGGLIEGNYTALLQAGIIGSLSNPVDATLSQTGLVPSDAKALLFKAFFSNGRPNLGVSLAGQQLSYKVIDTEPNYTLFAANIQPWAGQTTTLTFTAYAERPHLGNEYTFLDSVEFSNIEVPEPSTVLMMALGTTIVLLTLSFRRHSLEGLTAALIGLVSAMNSVGAEQRGSGEKAYNLFARTNLVAWCIVPFDSRKRGPEERAAMLERFGFKWFAYDYRAEHIPSFDAEMDALKRHHVRLLAWWFPGELNAEARLILDVLKRHELRQVQLWVTGGGEPTRSSAEQQARVAAEAARIRAIADEAAKIDCTVALYNHGGWFGEPENQIQIIEHLRPGGVTNLGIVYNQHHGHAHVARFPELLSRMNPYLVALNLNGMSAEGEKKLILPIGQGEFDRQLLRTIVASGWHGPVGILNHTDEDAEVRLRENLNGLERLAAELRDRPGKN